MSDITIVLSCKTVLRYCWKSKYESKSHFE